MGNGGKLKRGPNMALVLASIPAFFIGVGMLSVESSRYESNAANRSRDYARDAEYQIANHCPPPPSADRRECVEKAVYAARAEQRGEQDLAAQKVTAWWTRIMGAAAVAGMILSALGVYLVWTTFKATRKTAKAAVKANNIASQAMEGQLRPWLEVIIADHGDFAWDLRIGSTLKINVIVRNRGNSPATNVVVRAVLSGEADIPAPEDMRKAIGQVEEDLNFWDSHQTTGGTTIFPDAQEGPKEYAPTLISASVRAIQKTHPEARPFYMLAVGVRYRFGDKFARTIVSYFVRGAEEIDYSRPADIIGSAITLEDSFNGYAT